CPSLNAIPMLVLIATSLSSSGRATASVLITRWAISIALISLSESLIRTANSSPPRRAAVSVGRMQSSSRRPTSCSTLSPAACPRLSLTVLKSSMSRNRTATDWPLRCWAPRACSTRLRNSARLGRPVSVSWNAWCSSSACSDLRSLMSRILSTMPSTASSPRRFAPSASTSRQPSEAWRTEFGHQGLAGRLCRDRRKERRHAHDLVGVHHVGERTVAQGLREVPEHLLYRGAEVVDAAVPPHDADHVGGVLDERPQSRLGALVESLLRERRALERQRHLGGQRREALLRRAFQGHARHDGQDADELAKAQRGDARRILNGAVHGDERVRGALAEIQARGRALVEHGLGAVQRGRVDLLAGESCHQGLAGHPQRGLPAKRL